MFSRRISRTRRQKLREVLWPSMGLRRLMRYYKHRMGRLPGTPNYIASGFATGAAVSATPFIGLHMLIGLVICWISRSSVVAMLLGTVVAGNPWVLPLLWYGSYETGHAMLGAEATVPPEGLSISSIIENPSELFPMMAGSVPFFIVLWVLGFFICRHMVIKYKKVRI
jgi:uncharacterized protein (DUF2062 family)